MTEIKKGDRARITFEGTVSYVGKTEVDLRSDDGQHFLGYVDPRWDGITIEKIEPPVETFGPGDVVRQKHGYKHIYLIRPKGGFVNLTTKREYDYPFEFTSEYYERVTLS